MTFSPFNRQNQGQVAHQAQGGLVTQPQGLAAAQPPAGQYAPPATTPLFSQPVPAAAPVAGFGAPVNRFSAINFGPRGKPDLPHGDHVIELVPGDATRDPGAETGRWFYAPPGKSMDKRIAFAFKALESNEPTAVGSDFVHRQKLQVNSQGSDTIVYRKIGNILFALVGIAVPTAEDKMNLDASWDEFVQRGTLGGQSLIGLRCRVRVYDGKKNGPNGRPWPEYDFRPL